MGLRPGPAAIVDVKRFRRERRAPRRKALLVAAGLRKEKRAAEDKKKGRGEQARFSRWDVHFVARDWAIVCMQLDRGFTAPHLSGGFDGPVNA